MLEKSFLSFLYKKFLIEIVLFELNSSIKILEITNPEITKKISTPIKPPIKMSGKNDKELLILLIYLANHQFVLCIYY